MVESRRRFDGDFFRFWGAGGSESVDESADSTALESGLVSTEDESEVGSDGGGGGAVSTGSGAGIAAAPLVDAAVLVAPETVGQLHRKARARLGSSWGGDTCVMC